MNQEQSDELHGLWKDLDRLRRHRDHFTAKYQHTDADLNIFRWQEQRILDRIGELMASTK